MHNRSSTYANPLGRLFPPHWLQAKWHRFEAAGYSQPVTGVIYRGEPRPTCGLSLGGVDTGCLDIEPSGFLGYSTIFNQSIRSSIRKPRSRSGCEPGRPACPAITPARCCPGPFCQWVRNPTAERHSGGVVLTFRASRRPTPNGTTERRSPLPATSSRARSMLSTSKADWPEVPGKWPTSSPLSTSR
jgi:hypothetical protein